MDQPREMTTFKRADGEPIAGQFAYVGQEEYFEDDYEPTEYIKEKWILASRTRVWFPNQMTTNDDIERLL